MLLCLNFAETWSCSNLPQTISDSFMLIILAAAWPIDTITIRCVIFCISFPVCAVKSSSGWKLNKLLIACHSSLLNRLTSVWDSSGASCSEVSAAADRLNMVHQYVISYFKMLMRNSCKHQKEKNATFGDRKINQPSKWEPAILFKHPLLGFFPWLYRFYFCMCKKPERSNTKSNRS